MEAPASITVRKPRLDFGGDIPRFYLDDNPIKTHIFNALNLLFPDGERFFVKSVHDHAADIDDPRAWALDSDVVAALTIYREHWRANDTATARTFAQLEVGKFVPMESAICELNRHAIATDQDVPLMAATSPCRFPKTFRQLRYWWDISESNRGPMD